MTDKKYTQTWFWPVLFLIFLVLKLTDVISWSWLWVSAPLWMPMTILGFIWLTASLILCMITSVDKVVKKLQARTGKP